LFGNYVKSELHAVKGKNEKSIKGRQELVLRKLLGQNQSKFREPVATV
jgi:hypothetical protein